MFNKNVVDNLAAVYKTEQMLQVSTCNNLQLKKMFCRGEHGM